MKRRFTFVPVAAALLVLYDYAAYYLTISVKSSLVYSPKVMVGELGLVSFAGLLLTGAWIGSDLVAARIGVKSGDVLGKLAKYWAAPTVTSFIAFLIYKTSFQPHPFTTIVCFGSIFLLFTIATIRALNTRHGSRSFFARWSIELPIGLFIVLILSLILLDHWDRIFFRVAGLHIAGYHRLLSFFTFSTLLWLLTTKWKPSWSIPVILERIATCVSAAVAVGGMAALFLSPVTRASVTLNLRIGETLSVLFSPSVLGRDLAIGRLPAEDPPPLSKYLPEKSPAKSDAIGNKKARSVWLIIVDTLRADYAPCEGGSDSFIPREYQKRFSCFSRAYTVGNSTHIAIPSMLEGRYTIIGEPGHFAIGAMTGAGMQISGAASLAGMKERLGTDTGVLLQKYYPPPWEKVNEVARKVIPGLDRQRGFFFLSHYWEVHLPSWWPPSFFDTGPSWAIKHYKNGVATAKVGISDALSLADAENLWDDTIIIVTADHGEDLYEKGYYAHAYSMSEGLLRVPMYIYVPGLESFGDDRLVSILDIAATIDDLLSLGADGLEGRSLLSPSDDASRWVFSMPVGSQKFAVMHENFKYIWDRERLTHELYDLKADPTEIINLYETKNSLAREMGLALSSFVAERARFHTNSVVLDAIKRQEKRRAFKGERLD